MKKYIFEVVVNEESDEFWESIQGKPGCDEVREWIKDQLEAGGGLVCDGEYKNCELTLKRFVDE